VVSDKARLAQRGLYDVDSLLLTISRALADSHCADSQSGEGSSGRCLWLEGVSLLSLWPLVACSSGRLVSLVQLSCQACEDTPGGIKHDTCQLRNHVGIMVICDGAEADAEALAWCREWVSGLQAFVMNLDHQV